MRHPAFWVGVCLLGWLLLSGCEEGAQPLGGAGKCPPLTASGWLNGQPSTSDVAASGRVTVIDVWAFW